MRIPRSLLVLVVASGATFFSWYDGSRAEDAPTVGKDNGPFMVLVRRYKGSEAEGKAQALATELKKEYKLPAYLHRIEKDGSVVVVDFVGDAKNAKACEKLKNHVKKIKPKCLEKEPYHKDLSNAIETRNPLGSGK